MSHATDREVELVHKHIAKAHADGRRDGIEEVIGYLEEIGHAPIAELVRWDYFERDSAEFKEDQ